MKKIFALALSVAMVVPSTFAAAANEMPANEGNPYAPIEFVTINDITFGRATEAYDIVPEEGESSGDSSGGPTIYKGMPLFDGNSEHLDTFVDLIISEMGEQSIINAMGSGPVMGHYEGGEYTVTVGAGRSADVGNDGGTQWPNQLGVAQSWNKELTKEMGNQYGKEIRSESATNTIKGSTPISAHVAQIDPHLNPLSGRYDEGYGEDPYMISVLVDAWGNGMKGDESDVYYQAIANTKHWGVYNSEFFRMQGSYNLGARTFYEYFAQAANRPFSDGAILGYMSSYGRINGVPSTSSFIQKYAQTIAPEGLTSGCDFMSEYGYTNTAGWGTGGAFSNGYDLFYSNGMNDRNALMILAGHMQGGNALATMWLPEELGMKFDHSAVLKEDLDNNLFGITLQDVIDVIRPGIVSAVRTGAYDERDAEGQPKYYPYIISVDDKNAALFHQGEEIQNVELKAAEESVVLLKNNGVLPLSRESAIDVYGTFADVYQYGLYSAAINEIETDESLPTYSQQYGAGLTIAEALGAAEAFSEALAGKYTANENVKFNSGREMVTIQVGGKYVTADLEGNVTLTDTEEEGSYFEIESWGQDAYSFYSPVSAAWLDIDMVNNSNQTPCGINNIAVTATYKANFKPASHGQVIDSSFPDFFEIKNIDGKDYLKIGSKFNVTDFGANFAVPALMGWYLKNADGQFVVDCEITEGETNYVGTAIATEEAGMGAEYEMVITPVEQKIDVIGDTAIIAVGAVYNGIAGEGVDRIYLGLGDSMVSQAKAIAAAYKNAGKNTVVVIKADFPIEADNLEADENIDAILFAPLGGQYEGYAAAEIIYGDVNPSGKTVSTWYTSQNQLPAMDEFALVPKATVSVNVNGFGNPGFMVAGLPEEACLEGFTFVELKDLAEVTDMTDADLQSSRLTYQYFTGDVTYPFGYGLSYTEFAYSDMKINDASAEPFTVDVTVTNIGDVAGSEAVELYISKIDPVYGDAAQIKRLVSFEKVNLEAGESKTVELTVDPADFAIWDVNAGAYIVEDGAYVITVSDSSDFTSVNAISEEITIAGQTIASIPAGTEFNVWEHSFNSKNMKYDEYSKGQTIECVKDKAVRDDEFTVMSKEAGSFIAIPNVELTGVSAVSAQVASVESGNVVEIHIDSVDGEVIAVLEYDNTDPVTALRDEVNEELAGSYTELGYTTVEAAVAGVEGNHDIYLVFQSPKSRVATMTFCK